MSQKQYEGSDTPGCRMCKAQDSVMYAIPVLTDDIRARRGEDIICEDEEYSIDVCDMCLRFFASERLLAFRLSEAVSYSISSLKSRCGIKSADLEATHSSSRTTSRKEGTTEGETETNTTDRYDEERGDFCPKGKGNACASSDEMDLEEMRRTIEELEAIRPVSEPVAKSRSVENQPILNTTPTLECCPKEESADLSAPRSQQPRNACSFSREESGISSRGKWTHKWKRSFSSSKLMRSFSSSKLMRSFSPLVSTLRKSEYEIDMTGVVFEDGIPWHWDLAKPCNHRPSSFSKLDIGRNTSEHFTFTVPSIRNGHKGLGREDLS